MCGRTLKVGTWESGCSSHQARCTRGAHSARLLKQLAAKRAHAAIRTVTGAVCDAVPVLDGVCDGVRVCDGVCVGDADEDGHTGGSTTPRY